MTRHIGDVTNVEGGLGVYKEDEKFMWVIEGYGEWGEEIPQYLYEALNKFQDEQEAKQ